MRPDRPTSAAPANVLVISLSDLSSDPRVNRQIRWLSGRYAVVAAGLADPRIDGVRFVSLAPAGKPPTTPRHDDAAASVLRLAKRAARPAVSLVRRQFGKLTRLAGFHELNYWKDDTIRRAVALLEPFRPDLVVANDVVTLPLALRVARGAKVVLDTHEYAPDELADRLGWRLLERRAVIHRCRTCIPKADAVTTVCQGIADLYERDTGVRPVVVTNAPDYEPLPPRFKSPDDSRVRMVHHGSGEPSRKIENMILATDFLDDRFTLDLMLVPGDPGYIERLREMAATRPRVRFLPPVPMRSLPAFCNGYDVGLFLLAPTNTNYRLALPNKFFEFVMSRLAIAVGPSPEMARIVRERELGVVSDDFSPEAMARALSTLSAGDINRFKANSDAAARDLSSERNRELLLALAARVLGETGRGA